MKKIVIIEDDKILREELEILLNDSGYQAEILSDFTDAAAQVRQIRPDLVLLDIILPGANGQYILRQIREKLGCSCHHADQQRRGSRRDHEPQQWGR